MGVSQLFERNKSGLTPLFTLKICFASPCLMASVILFVDVCSLFLKYLVEIPPSENSSDATLFQTFCAALIALAFAFGFGFCALLLACIRKSFLFWISIISCVNIQLSIAAMLEKQNLSKYMLQCLCHLLFFVLPQVDLNATVPLSHLMTSPNFSNFRKYVFAVVGCTPIICANLRWVYRVIAELLCSLRTISRAAMAFRAMPSDFTLS